MIDSHCHLADAKFADDLSDVIQRAVKNGVDSMVTIADTLEEAEKCIAIAEKYDQIFATVGVHPHEAKSWKKDDDNRLRSLAQSSKKVKAVGEIGLDYHYDFSPRDTQREVFAAQLRLAKELQMPVVVHCRGATAVPTASGEAVEDLWKIVSEEKPASLVLHCCTEKWEDVERFIDVGYLLSFTGIVTYPNAADIKNTIKLCPLSQMMVETDAPYLAPVPHRGKRNEPAFVLEVAKEIANIKGVSVEEVDATTTSNAERFYLL